ALRDFRLVWHIGGVPAGILKNVTKDHRRRDRPVIAHADQRLLHHVTRRETTQFGDHRGLIYRRWQIQYLIGTDRLGDGGGGGIVQADAANHAQHRGDLGLGRTDMAREAALLGGGMRIRAVLMTSIAFIVGLIPLVWAHGAAMLSRRAEGTAVFAGMIVATCIGVFL